MIEDVQIEPLADFNALSRSNLESLDCYFKHRSYVQGHVQSKFDFSLLEFLLISDLSNLVNEEEYPSLCRWQKHVQYLKRGSKQCSSLLLPVESVVRLLIRLGEVNGLVSVVVRTLA